MLINTSAALPGPTDPTDKARCTSQSVWSFLSTVQSPHQFNNRSCCWKAKRRLCLCEQCSLYLHDDTVERRWNTSTPSGNREVHLVFIHLKTRIKVNSKNGPFLHYLFIYLLILLILLVIVMIMVLYNDADHRYHHMSLSPMIKTVCIDNDYKLSNVIR